MTPSAASTLEEDVDTLRLDVWLPLILLLTSPRALSTLLDDDASC
jgi:hypothetical protein